MADSKKYNGSQWEHSLRKLGTATDTLTTLPADVYADGNNATVSLKGNMVQTGTPTPSSPIQPTECGDLETTGTYTGQYKIPISSANTTTPVYLGEVETTRKIKKLVLTGQENWFDSSINTQKRYAFSLPNTSVNGSTVSNYCTHYQYEYSTTGTGFNIASSGTSIYFRDNNYTSLDDWKAYLAQEYANGTPVTVWYVLATEETAVVNEPLRKIGDYADEVSGITIPTIAGADSFDVLTTLKPSKVELTYTGWHDSTVNEWDGSDWQ